LKQGYSAFLLVVVTAAFVWVLSLFTVRCFGARFFAMMFRPLFSRLLKRMPERRTRWRSTRSCHYFGGDLAAGLDRRVLSCRSHAQHSRIQSGDFSPATYFQQIYSARCRSGWACWTALAWAARV
jgi:hypothetical protein